MNIFELTNRLFARSEDMTNHTISRAVKRAHLTLLTLVAVTLGVCAASPAQAQFLAVESTVKTDCYFKIERSDGKKKSRALLASRQSENYFANKDLMVHFSASYFDGINPVTATIHVANGKTREIYPMFIKVGKNKPEPVFGGQVELNKDMDFKLLAETPFGHVTATCSYF